MGKFYGYIRVSTKDQKLDRQENAMNEYEVTNNIVTVQM
ncbi:MAG TPA: recombinase family protein [Clostridiaceae bacterium]